MSDQGLDLSISRVAAVDFLDDLKDAYRRRHHRNPVEISHWDPSPTIVRELGAAHIMSTFGEPVRYRFSFQMEHRKDILRKLGYGDGTRRILLTENGTSAILAVANVLALSGIKRVHLLSPCYFATEYALRRFNIDVIRVYWMRERGAFSLPSFTVDVGEALWFEDPIFATGLPCPQTLYDLVSDLTDMNRLVVCDQSLGSSLKSTSHLLAAQSGFMTIHSPHKVVSINGFKFGAATFNSAFYDGFDHWADVLSGGLSLSAEAASLHFLSDDYASFQTSFTRHVSQGAKELMKISSRFVDVVHFDSTAIGQWRTVYVPRLSAAAGEDKDWLAELTESTGALLIPGTWSGCHTSWEFCFRINLLRCDPQARAGLRRLFFALEHATYP